MYKNSQIFFEILNELPMMGIGHRHWLVKSPYHKNQKLILRTPTSLKAGFTSYKQYIEYQEACYKLLESSCHTPQFIAAVYEHPLYQFGGLLIQYIEGRLPQKNHDWPRIASCLASIHRLPTHTISRLIPAPTSIWQEIIGTIQHRQPYFQQPFIPTAIQNYLKCELDWAIKFFQQHQHKNQPRTIMLYDCHPANFLIDQHDKAWFLDLEKVTLGHPALDLAHATIITSRSWHPYLEINLSPEDETKFYETYFQEHSRQSIQDITFFIQPARRLVWLRTLSWAAEWLAQKKDHPPSNIFDTKLMARLLEWFKMDFFYNMVGEINSPPTI